MDRIDAVVVGAGVVGLAVGESRHAALRRLGATATANGVPVRWLDAREAVAIAFRIDGAERHGMAGLVNLFGIESPGLTSSLAIAETVLARLHATIS